MFCKFTDMKKAGIITLIALVVLFAASFQTNSASVQDDLGGELKWYTDLDEAHEASDKAGKPIFGFFTGSDWCGWCHKLQREFFAKDAFIKWAKEEVILWELDFPRKKQLPAELAKQNQD